MQNKFLKFLLVFPCFLGATYSPSQFYISDRVPESGLPPSMMVAWGRRFITPPDEILQFYNRCYGISSQGNVSAPVIFISRERYLPRVLMDPFVKRDYYSRLDTVRDAYDVSHGGSDEEEAVTPREKVYKRSSVQEDDQLFEALSDETFIQNPSNISWYQQRKSARDGATKNMLDEIIMLEEASGDSEPSKESKSRIADLHDMVKYNKGMFDASYYNGFADEAYEGARLVESQLPNRVLDQDPTPAMYERARKAQVIGSNLQQLENLVAQEPLSA